MTPNSCKVRKFAPVYEGWGEKRTVSDFRDKEFVDCDPLFSEREWAQKYADSNRGNYPYCTTGRVVLVEVTVTPIES